MPEQENKERIIRLEEQMKAIKASLDDLTREVREGFRAIKAADDLLESKYVTRSEFNGLKKAHAALTQRLWWFVALILGAVIYFVFKQVGLD